MVLSTCSSPMPLSSMSTFLSPYWTTYTGRCVCVIDLMHGCHSLIPRPSPSFLSLAVLSDGKLGEGLGTRLRQDLWSITTWLWEQSRRTEPTVSHKSQTNMWQSRVEIEGYFVAYFDRFAAFKVPYRWTSVKGGAHMRFIDSLDIHASAKHVWALPLTGVQRYTLTDYTRD